MIPEKYTKKPITIEAARVTETNQDSVITWILEHDGDVEVLSPHMKRAGGLNDTYAFQIKTLEGFMWAMVGDYVIRGIKGEFYPCKPDIFAGSYDKNEAPTSAGIPGLGVQYLRDL